MYYLDNAATTRPYPAVIEKVNQILTENFGNPSSVHPLGIKAARQVEESRKILADTFKVPVQGVIFCGSGSASDNLAIKGVIDLSTENKVNIITTPMEHSAVFKTVKSLETENVEVRLVKINPTTGQLDFDHLAELVDEKTRLVTVQHVNNEIGVINDLDKISQVIRKKNPKVIFHVDGVQAFGKVPVNLRKTKIDLYSISAHKLHGLKGIGALILGRNVKLSSLITGGGQEHGMRAGTENVPAIAAFGEATKISLKERKENFQKVEEFSNWFKERVEAEIPEANFFLPENKIPHILSLFVKDVLGEVLLHHLATEGIYVSTGSACNARSNQLSPSFLALGFDQKRIMETIRISFSTLEIPEDREKMIQIFIKTVKELQKTVKG